MITLETEVLPVRRDPLREIWAGRKNGEIIRLQAALEIITNKTADTIDLLTWQSQQMRTAILQHHMVFRLPVS